MNKYERAGIGIMWSGFLIAFFILVHSAANAGYSYNFPAREGNPVITMDVIKNGPGGGTYKCIDVVTCYHYVRNAEDRGATQYCKKIVIKRNGYPVITRDYGRWNRVL